MGSMYWLYYQLVQLGIANNILRIPNEIPNEFTSTEHRKHARPTDKKL